MFLRPYFKYFLPYRWRLIVAVLCMIAIGALSAAPIFILRETIKVFVQTTGVSDDDLEQMGDVGKFVSLSRNKSAQDKPASKTSKAQSAPKNGLQAEVSHLKQWVDAQKNKLKSMTVYQWGKTKSDQFKAWYSEAATRHPQQALGFLAVALLVLTVIKGVMTFLSKYELAYTFFLTNLQIREDIFSNILRQDYIYFNRNSAGWLHSRINSDIKALRNILDAMLSDGVQQPITLIVMVCVLLYFSVKLTLITIIILPIVGGILYHFARVLRKNTQKQKRKADLLSSCMTESLQNIRLVKAFGTEQFENQKFHERTMALFQYMMARRVAKFGSTPIMETLGMAAAGGVIIMGGWMILGNPPEMDLATFAAYMVTLTRFHRPLKSLAQLNSKYQEARVSTERMTEMLVLNPQVVEASNPVPFERLSQGVRFENVCFSYGDDLVLTDINLEVQAGRSVAFAGPSGSGKTTLVNMLARLFDPTRGRILIDGVDLREIRMSDWRKHLAIVTQDTVLFDDTVANNIAYGSDTMDMARVEEAARAANAHEFILGLDGGLGYATMLGPTGARLSGGQRQRLAIARAIYRDPQILILDEATSALDAQSQALVQEALGRLMVGRTTFVIAHRISTIRNVDCIHVLQDGRIVESGSHDRLLDLNGHYAMLVHHSSGGGFEDGPPSPLSSAMVRD